MGWGFWPPSPTFGYAPAIRPYHGESDVKLSYPSIFYMIKRKSPPPQEKSLTTPLKYISGLRGANHCLFQFRRLLSA